jgi:hypothetical protein
LGLGGGQHRSRHGQIMTCIKEEERRVMKNKIIANISLFILIGMIVFLLANKLLGQIYGEEYMLFMLLGVIETMYILILFKVSANIFIILRWCLIILFAFLSVYIAMLMFSELQVGLFKRIFNSYMIKTLFFIGAFYFLNYVLFCNKKLFIKKKIPAL